MTGKKMLACLFLCLIVFAMNAAAEEEEAQTIFETRGVYVYDEAGVIDLEPELELNYILLQKDGVSGYEVVVVYPTKVLTLDEMGAWFDSHGVGKEGRDNGVVIFIFPDNTVYGLIGPGHDQITVSHLADYDHALEGLEDDKVMATLNLVNAILADINDPVVIAPEESFGEKAYDNFDIVMAWIAFLCMIVFAIMVLKDGFQPSDLGAAAVVFVVLLLAFGLPAVFSEATAGVETDYGVITSTHPGSYPFTETHTVSNGKTTSTYVDTHIAYTNDVTIKSYNLRDYKYQFETRKYDGVSGIQIGEYRKLGLNAKTHKLVWEPSKFRAFSGGITNRYGCSIDYEPSAKAGANTTAAAVA